MVPDWGSFAPALPPSLLSPFLSLSSARSLAIWVSIGPASLASFSLFLVYFDSGKGVGMGVRTRKRSHLKQDGGPGLLILG